MMALGLSLISKIVGGTRFVLLCSILKWFPVSFSTFMQNKTRFEYGRFSQRLRYEVYKRLCKRIGINVVIKEGVYIKEPENIEIGNNVSIQEYCLLSGYGGLIIGDNVSIAAGTMIFTSSHSYSDKSINFRNSILEIKPVRIGNNVWIGAGCRIIGGSIIGNNVIVGAGSVINKTLTDNGIYAGIPARLIKEL